MGEKVKMSEYITHIKAKNKWLDVNLKEIIEYRDLIFLFVKRNFIVQYKQTILGPLWFVLNPLLTTLIYTFVFGNIAHISTEGVPQFTFYLVSNAIWTYFSLCITQTSNTFTSNAAIFGKVYFPRLTMPIATVIYSLINFSVIFVMAIVAIAYYMTQGYSIRPNAYILVIPILIVQTALLGLGSGIIVSALTTKYRDLAILVSFGVQLWMYITPIVYPTSQLSPFLQKVIMINPLAPIVNNFRYALLGCGHFENIFWYLSIIVTIIILSIGIILFNKVEKTFMDTV